MADVTFHAWHARAKIATAPYQSKVETKCFSAFKNVKQFFSKKIHYFTQAT
ncbi:hypothetical protein [Polaromonas sp. CG9_12]|nr:hypothetical protein [Polaromonas sp. CG9_12]